MVLIDDCWGTAILSVTSTEKPCSWSCPLLDTRHGGWGAAGCCGTHTCGTAWGPRRNGDHEWPWTAWYLMVDHGYPWTTIKIHTRMKDQTIKNHGHDGFSCPDHGLHVSVHVRPWTQSSCPWLTMDYIQVSMVDHGLCSLVFGWQWTLSSGPWLTVNYN